MSSIGIEQLKKVDNFIEKRKEIACFYDQNLRILEQVDIPPELPKHMESSYYMYWIQLEDRDEMAKYLKDNGIYTTFRYYPLHMVDYFKEYKVSLPITEKVMNNTLLLPIHQSLSKRDTKKIVNKIREFYEKS